MRINIMASDLPVGVTAGQLAKIIGTNERSIAGRKSDGRLPVLPNGAIDLLSIIRTGVTALGRTRSVAGDLRKV
jgi:hypothetical protein